MRPVALVTGGRRGIGLAIARRLAADGFDLVVTDRLPDDGTVASLAEFGGAVTYLTGDLADLSDHQAWIEAVLRGPGRVDCLVNNAGMGSVARGDVLDLTPENFDRIMAVNLRGTAFLTHAVLPRLMLAQTPGPVPRSIVNITSVSASEVSVERLDYCVSKAALAMWSKGLAARFAKDGIAVFDVRPGIIRTDMTAPVTDRYDRLIADGAVPAMRWGVAEDVAKVVAGLASGAFAYATGSIIAVDGGLSIGRF